jgi:type I restriction enzyme S subunit
MIKESIIKKITLPKDWKMLPFGDVCEISGGSQPPKPTFIYEPKEGYIRLVQVRDYRTNNFITYIPKEKAKKFCNKTDIMIGRYGPPIFGIFRGLEGAYNVALMKAIPNKELLNQEYLYWFLKTDSLVKFVEKSSKRAAGQDGVRKEVLYTYPTPIPPLPQQKQIVATLDKAFAAIDTAKANAEQNLQNAKELFESYLQNVFENKGNDWKEKTLEQIADVFGRGKSKHRPRNDKKLYGGNYPFIQTGDIRNSEHFITDYTQTYNETGLAQSKLWPKGTICITIAANIAETGILSFDSCFPDSVIGIVVDKKQAKIDYVEYLLQYFKVNIQSLSQGSAQENINLGTFKDKLFPFPSLEEQKQIVQKLDTLLTETKKLAAIYTQKIADLEEMKKSVLQKAFSGQLNTIN